MNKILFTQNCYIERITVVANNKKDLEEFLLKRGYDYIYFSDDDDGESSVVSLIKEGLDTDYGKIQWIKQV